MQRRCSVFIWLRSELELRAGWTEENVTAVSQDELFHGWKNCGNKALTDQTAKSLLANKGNAPLFLHQGQFDHMCDPNELLLHLHMKGTCHLILKKTIPNNPPLTVSLNPPLIVSLPYPVAGPNANTNLSHRNHTPWAQRFLLSLGSCPSLLWVIPWIHLSSCSCQWPDGALL